MKIKPKFEIFRGCNGSWGVGEKYQSRGKTAWATLYDPSFCKRTAQRIADLENSDNPPEDWEKTRDLLERDGYDLTVKDI